MSKHPTRALVAFLAFTSFAAAAHAQEEWTGLRSMGMGGAHRAIVTGNDSIFLNPAGMSQTKKYVIEGEYLYDFGRESHAPGGSVVDSATSPVAAGLAYNYVSGKRTLQVANPLGGSMEQKVDRTGHIAHLAMSAPVGRTATLGVAAKWMSIDYSGRSAISSVTVDAGMLMRPSPTLALAITGYGLTNTGSAEAPLAMAVGLALGPPAKFQFAVDWIIDFTSRGRSELLPLPRPGGTSHNVNIGFEWLIAQAFAVRAGYFHDRTTRITPDNGLAIGLGYVSARSKFGFQVAFQQRFLNTDERMLIAGIQLFM